MSEEKNRQESQRWLSQAHADLQAARASLSAGSCEWACFQSQQAGEKALKALWFHYNADPWGHSLTRLIEQFPVSSVRTELLKLAEQARHLDRMYIPTRYPNGLPDLAPFEAFVQRDAEESIHKAQSIIEFVNSATA